MTNKQMSTLALGLLLASPVLGQESPWNVEGSVTLGPIYNNTNDTHVTGATHTGFEGRVKLAIEPRWSISF